MKVAVTGKGGVGKTTVAASLARALRDLGREVVAVDADPDTNLAGCLGYRGPEIAPLTQWKALINERVGGGDGWGGFLRMNPRVDDIPEQCGVVIDGIRLLVMGTIERGRRGCACPESVLLREVLEPPGARGGPGRGRRHGGRDRAPGPRDGRGRRHDAGRRRAGLGRACRRRRVSPASPRTSASGVSASSPTASRRTPSAISCAPASGRCRFVGVLPVDPELEREARAGAYQKDRPFHREMARIAATIGSAREGSL